MRFGIWIQNSDCLILCSQQPIFQLADLILLAKYIVITWIAFFPIVKVSSVLVNSQLFESMVGWLRTPSICLLWQLAVKRINIWRTSHLHRELIKLGKPSLSSDNMSTTEYYFLYRNTFSSPIYLYPKVKGTLAPNKGPNFGKYLGPEIGKCYTVLWQRHCTKCMYIQELIASWLSGIVSYRHQKSKKLINMTQFFKNSPFKGYRNP